MENKEFIIDKDGFKLHARIDFPKEQKEKMPLIILMHGLTGYKEEWHLSGITDTANECGYAVLRFDFYGHGKSDGDFFNHNIYEEVSEALFVIDYARKLDFVSDIILSGHSQGGLVTILTAPLKANQLKAIMPLSPALNIPVDCRNGEFFGASFDPENVPDEILFWENRLVGGNYIRLAQSIDAKPSIEAYDGPVFLLHGGDDGAVFPKYSIEAEKLFKNATLNIIEGDGHCYENHLDKAKLAVGDFLKKLMN